MIFSTIDRLIIEYWNIFFKIFPYIAPIITGWIGYEIGKKNKGDLK